MKKWLIPLSLLLIAVIIAVVGSQYQERVIAKNKAAWSEHSREAEKIRSEREEKEKQQEAAEKQAIIDSHKDEELVYIPMGDSLAVGSFAKEENDRYVSVLAQKIEDELGYKVTVKDIAAESGTGLKDNGLVNLDAVLAEKPNFVTVEFGTNDLNEELENAYSNEEDFKERLEELISSLKENMDQDNILLITTWRSGQESIKYDRIISQVGDNNEIPVVNIQSVWNGRSDTFGPEGEETFYGTSDNWHPNSQGHLEIAEMTFEKAYDMLK